MQFHKDQKKQRGTKDSAKSPAKSLDDSTKDRVKANLDADEQASTKRPFPMQRKGAC